MAPRRTNQPTPAELEILQIVWERGSASVREVFEALGTEREVGYTTVLKLMQIMHEKDMLTRDASARSHRFTAALDRGQTQKEIVDNLIAKAFSGSPVQLVEVVLAHVRNSKADFTAIQALIVSDKKAAPTKKTAAPAKKVASGLSKTAKPVKKTAVRKKAPAASRK